MDHSVAHTSVSRRSLLRLFSSSLALLPFLGIAFPSAGRSSGAFSLSLALQSAPKATGPLPFVVRIAHPESAPSRLKSIQLFAPGDATPRKVRFDVDDVTRTVYAGQLPLERSQYVMALAEFSDGTLIHDRRFASLAPT